MTYPKLMTHCSVHGAKPCSLAKSARTAWQRAERDVERLIITSFEIGAPEHCAVCALASDEAHALRAMQASIRSGKAARTRRERRSEMASHER